MFVIVILFSFQKHKNQAVTFDKIDKFSKQLKGRYVFCANSFCKTTFTIDNFKTRNKVIIVYFFYLDTFQTIIINVISLYF